MLSNPLFYPGTDGREGVGGATPQQKNDQYVSLCLFLSIHYIYIYMNTYTHISICIGIHMLELLKLAFVVTCFF